MEDLHDAGRRYPNYRTVVQEPAAADRSEKVASRVSDHCRGGVEVLESLENRVFLGPRRNPGGHDQRDEHSSAPRLHKRPPRWGTRESELGVPKGYP